MCCCYFPQQENPRDVSVEELHLPLEKRPSRNDDLTIAMLVVRVRPYCSSKNLRSPKAWDLKSQISQIQISKFEISNRHEILMPSVHQFA